LAGPPSIWHLVSPSRYILPKIVARQLVCYGRDRFLVSPPAPPRPLPPLSSCGASLQDNSYRIRSLPKRSRPDSNQGRKFIQPAIRFGMWSQPCWLSQQRAACGPLMIGGVNSTAPSLWAQPTAGGVGHDRPAPRAPYSRGEVADCLSVYPPGCPPWQYIPFSAFFSSPPLGICKPRSRSQETRFISPLTMSTILVPRNSQTPLTSPVKSENRKGNYAHVFTQPKSSQTRRQLRNTPPGPRTETANEFGRKKGRKKRRKTNSPSPLQETRSYSPS